MLIFEDCANSALPARFLPLPRRFFCVRMARDASGGMFRMRRKDGAICGAASAAPRAISFLRRNGALCLRRHTFFLSCQKRMGRKEAPGTRDRADAPEKAFCFCVPFTDSASRKERPSGGPQNFCHPKILLRQIFLPAKSKSICSGSMRGFQDLPVSASQPLLVAEEKRAK